MSSSNGRQNPRPLEGTDHTLPRVGSKRRVSSNATKPLPKRIHSGTEDDELVAERNATETTEPGDEMEDLQPSRSQSTVDQTPSGCPTPEAPTDQHEKLSQWSFGKDYFPTEVSELSETPSPRSGSTAQSPLSGATETSIWRIQYMELQEPDSPSESQREEELDRRRRNAISGTEPELRPFRQDSMMEEEDEDENER